MQGIAVGSACGGCPCRRLECGMHAGGYACRVLEHRVHIGGWSAEQSACRVLEWGGQAMEWVQSTERIQVG